MPSAVFVSGCYDMLHSGHVAFFEEAASYGDLYVGLGSDQTIWELKGRKTINNERERLYMVKAVRYVKDAWINSGNGIMDFEKEVRALKPDIFFVNADGYTPEKEAFCKELGIKLIVSKRIPREGLPVRSTPLFVRNAVSPIAWNCAAAGWISQALIHWYPVLSSSCRSNRSSNSMTKAAWRQVLVRKQSSFGRRRYRQAIGNSLPN